MTNMERPKITDDAKFIAKIYEALVTATDFQPGEGTYMYKDWFIVIPDATGRYKCKVGFFENETTLDYKQ